MPKQKMTSSEAFVETLAAEGVKVAFGIVGSAFMDALDMFPDAGIRFVSVAHEQAACHAATVWHESQASRRCVLPRMVLVQRISYRR